MRPLTTIGTLALLSACWSSLLLRCLAGVEADALLRAEDVSTDGAANKSAGKPARKPARKTVSRASDKAANRPANKPVNKPAGRIALLLRGQPFRSGLRFAEGCQNTAVDAQLRSTASLVRHIIEPLEGIGMQVEIFTVLPRCSLNSQLQGILQEKRIVKALTRRTETQSENMRLMLDTFKRKAGKAEKYNLVIVTRHDMRWHKSILRWPTANFTGFNFFSRCEKTPYVCVHDALHMMPGSMFKVLDRAVGKYHCFHSEESHGHGCLKYVSPPLMAGQVHVATDWVFQKNCRDHSDIGGIQFAGSPEDAPTDES